MRNIRLNWPWRWLRHGIVERWDDPPPVFIGSPSVAQPEFGIIDPDVQRIRAEQEALLMQNANASQMLAMQLAMLQAIPPGNPIYYGPQTTPFGGNPWGLR